MAPHRRRRRNQTSSSSSSSSSGQRLPLHNMPATTPATAPSPNVAPGSLPLTPGEPTCTFLALVFCSSKLLPPRFSSLLPSLLKSKALIISFLWSASRYRSRPLQFSFICSSKRRLASRVFTVSTRKLHFRSSTRPAKMPFLSVDGVHLHYRTPIGGTIVETADVKSEPESDDFSPLAGTPPASPAPSCHPPTSRTNLFPVVSQIALPPWVLTRRHSSWMRMSRKSRCRHLQDQSLASQTPRAPTGPRPAHVMMDIKNLFPPAVALAPRTSEDDDDSDAAGTTAAALPHAPIDRATATASATAIDAANAHVARKTAPEGSGLNGTSQS
ncbi:hypothetical protein FDECE_4079 [Fusarium decemcellulare]|nr:hypothetical protein FDECE_4079 [Fusarium decemcellulare]